jgi:transposase
MLEVTKNAPQMAMMQLGQAFKNSFAKRSQYPPFRRKGRDDRFTLTNDQFKADDSKIHIIIRQRLDQHLCCAIANALCISNLRASMLYLLMK